MDPITWRWTWKILKSLEDEHEQEKSLNHLEMNMNITKNQLQIHTNITHTKNLKNLNLDPIKKKRPWIKTLYFSLHLNMDFYKTWILGSKLCEQNPTYESCDLHLLLLHWYFSSETLKIKTIEFEIKPTEPKSSIKKNFAEATRRGRGFKAASIERYRTDFAGATRRGRGVDRKAWGPISPELPVGEAVQRGVDREISSWFRRS